MNTEHAALIRALAGACLEFIGWAWVSFCFGLALFLLVPAAYGAEPLRFEAAAGVCQYGQAGKGIWWNDAYPTAINLRTACWSVGASQVRGQWHGVDLGWRAAYTDLGKYKADNQFALLDTEQFTVFDPSTCNPATGSHCTGRGVMGGRTRGIALSGLAERRLGPAALGVEAGALLYYSRFDVAVYSTSGPNTGAHLVNLNWGGPGITPFMGLTASYGALFGTIRAYADVKAHEPKCQGCSGITDGLAWQATLGVQF